MATKAEQEEAQARPIDFSKGDTVKEAEKAEDRIKEIEEEHRFKGEQMTPEEYDKVGRPKDYEPRDPATRNLPREDTLPQSSVAYPEGREAGAKESARTRRSTTRQIESGEGGSVTSETKTSRSTESSSRS